MMVAVSRSDFYIITHGPCFVKTFFIFSKSVCVKEKNKRQAFNGLPPLVEVTGFEPAASSSRTKRSTKLSHTSICCLTFSVTAFILYRAFRQMSTLFQKKFPCIFQSSRAAECRPQSVNEIHLGRCRCCRAAARMK